MKFVFLVSLKKDNLEPLKTVIPGEYKVLEGELNDSSFKILKTLAPGVVVVGEGSNRTDWAERAHKKNPTLTFLEICRGKKSSSLFYDCIPSPFAADQVKIILERAWERSALMVKVQALKKQGEIEENGFYSQDASFSFPASRAKEKVLWDFSRALGNNFNQERLLNLFLDTVKELVPVTILSLLLPKPEEGNYHIFSQKGLDPELCRQISFNPSRGLLAYIAEEGHIIRLENNTLPFPRWENFVEVLQEMHLLQSVLFIPLMVHGQLAGVLSLGPKITGSPFFEDELEMLYSLAGNVALALRDIELHHQLCYQKEYTEKILRHMTSGLISVNNKNRVVNFNTRAGEILTLEPEEAIEKDLRFLPSPLGDLLFETRETGKSYHKQEIVLKWNNLPLDISSYPLYQEEKEGPAGSVIIFDDISERKQLEFQKRQAAQLEILNKFVGQLAHEVKNPMVAIQTFCELLPEKYQDESFREFFSTTVTQEVERLNELVEKLIAFATNLSYERQLMDVHEALEEGFKLLHSQGKLDSRVTLGKFYSEEKLIIRANKTLLARAFSYLVHGTFQSLEKGGTLNVETLYDANLFKKGGVLISLWDSVTVADKKYLESLFDPLYTGQTNYISLGLPVSRKIIEEHDGVVEAAAGEKEGLVFKISLPIYQEGGKEEDG